ncbi:MAG: Lrp/AsnC family transcriptional regulator [Candidatus Bathyarchaeota archaeon]|nr:Lrp/AsnC family transcriptional regulator [Candidatus Bathyarchaeota archaeon]MDH5623680.1 Lrp/AsnC family transcriptional regulator [Candidatus Bathyarchaeota archaeon]MDH5635631.1 Lrp/AsnC family transcriptional regulator [Candidatus Bathyarchaeota archaeon]MDH5701796.1 Lrp/AsnC family transcriptional regulator [Candidatus Bathyarchaeota archaeon]
MGMAKQNMIKLLYEMMKNSKRSDREIAKIIGVSQPTITRMRQRLEKTGYIRDYTVIPNLEKLGYEIAAFTFVTTGNSNAESENMNKWIESNSKIVFSASGDGINGKNSIMVSIHKDFTDYAKFMSELRSKWSENIRNIDGFLVPLKGDIQKHFSFKYLQPML